MKTLTKYLVLILIGIILFAGAWYMGFKSQWGNHYTVDQSQVLLEKVKKVSQLVTVRGQFSEVYKHKDYHYLDLDMFTKKALLRVQATVSIGYDIEDFILNMDELTKTIEISDLGRPQILSIDHDLDYYDISQGTFNGFKPEDYNRINKRAKNFIEDKARRSALYQTANDQKAEIYNMLRLVVEGAGWDLKINYGLEDQPTSTLEEVLN